MVDLIGHETGNGGYSQRTPTALPGLLYSEPDGGGNSIEKLIERPASPWQWKGEFGERIMVEV